MNRNSSDSKWPLSAGYLRDSTSEIYRLHPGRSLAEFSSRIEAPPNATLTDSDAANGSELPLFAIDKFDFLLEHHYTMTWL